ncbi:hypothetical protein K438DRAFT_1753367 [Mycena galopus ATCC 62051]|nr:hypothetical protein K438DRAFT_1753367 [Mycena galopus ATCC 62051]
MTQLLLLNAIFSFPVPMILVLLAFQRQMCPTWDRTHLADGPHFFPFLSLRVTRQSMCMLKEPEINPPEISGAALPPIILFAFYSDLASDVPLKWLFLRGHTSEHTSEKSLFKLKVQTTNHQLPLWDTIDLDLGNRKKPQSIDFGPESASKMLSSQYK